jgi:hypothetical protein
MVYYVFELPILFGDGICRLETLLDYTVVRICIGKVQ